MSITFTTASGQPIRAWPIQFKPAQITLHLRYNTSALSSPFSRSVQTLELPGALFGVEASFPPVGSAQAAQLRSFFALLRGGSGRFYFPVNPCRYAPAAMYASERVTMLPLTVDDTYITGDTTIITVDATQVQMESVFTVSSCPDAVTIIGTLWLNSKKAPLQEGGYISWDSPSGWRQLHLIVGLSQGSNGQATLKLEPPMRSRPMPATPMHVHAPSGIFRLSDDGQGALAQSGRLHSYSIAAVEALPLSLTVPS